MRLVQARNTRVRPGLDDKVVASWNGLAIRALAEAGAVLDEQKYLEAAVDCARFVTTELFVDGRLMRSWRDGRATVGGFLEDHASVAVGLFSLYQVTGDYIWFETAETLTRGLSERFGDPEGGFFDTPADGPYLIKRPKSQADNPLPSGNGLAAEALATLAAYTGEAALRELAEKTLSSSGLLMEQYPSMVGRHLAVARSMSVSREVAVVGPEWAGLAGVYWEAFRPGTVLAGSVDGSEPIPLLADRFLPGQTRAFVCSGFVCDLPVDSREGLRDQLG